MLITLKDIHLSFGPKLIFQGLDLAVEESDRICLIGRNGCGKSTLFKLITHQLTPDQGEYLYRKYLGIKQLLQILIPPSDQTIFEFVKEGLKEQELLIQKFETLTQEIYQPDLQQMSETETPKTERQLLRELEELQNTIETTCGWNLNLNVERILSELKLPSKMKLTQLSGGFLRKVGLAQALVSKPDLLLLDEPTNHLDLATIEWLEDRINSYPGAVMFITHDRNFLQNIAGRIIELERGAIYEYPGNYEEHLSLKKETIQHEKTHNKLFDKKLHEEEVWIRQGIKARRTRNEGRVRALMSMREERAKRINRPRDISIEISESDSSGKKIVDLEHVYYNYHSTGSSNSSSKPHWIIKDFNLRIKRGEKIVLVGNNGVGKSTLLKIILGEINPNKGTVKFGTNLKPVFFNQIGGELKQNQTIAYNICDGKNYIEMNGKSIHVIGYLKNYLFQPDQANEKVNTLSGGEQNRILLARLFASPNNLLILDEPTNDLDLEMIEALEKAILNYQGTVIMVSHDRFFIDRVASSCLIFEADGSIHKYLGGYSDWQRLGKELRSTELLSLGKALNNERKDSERKEKIEPSESAKMQSQSQSVRAPLPKKTNKSKKKLKEIKFVIDNIEKVEVEIDYLSETITTKEFQKQNYAEKESTFQRLKDLEEELAGLNQQWMELEEA